MQYLYSEAQLWRKYRFSTLFFLIIYNQLFMVRSLILKVFNSGTINHQLYKSIPIIFMVINITGFKIFLIKQRKKTENKKMPFVNFSKKIKSSEERQHIINCKIANYYQDKGWENTPAILLLNEQYTDYFIILFYLSCIFSGLNNWLALYKKISSYSPINNRFTEFIIWIADKNGHCLRPTIG